MVWFFFVSLLFFWFASVFSLDARPHMSATSCKVLTELPNAQELGICFLMFAFCFFNNDNWSECIFSLFLLVSRVFFLLLVSLRTSLSFWTVIHSAAVAYYLLFLLAIVWLVALVLIIICYICYCHNVLDSGVSVLDSSPFCELCWNGVNSLRILPIR